MPTASQDLASDTGPLDRNLQRAILLLCLSKFDEGLLCLKSSFEIDISGRSFTVVEEQISHTSDPILLACTALALKLSAKSSSRLSDQWLRRALMLSTDLRGCLGHLSTCGSSYLETHSVDLRLRQFMTASLGLWLRQDVLAWSQSLCVDKTSKLDAARVAASEGEWDDNSYMLTELRTSDSVPGQSPDFDGHKRERSQQLCRLEMVIVYLIAALSFLALAAFLLTYVKSQDRDDWWQSQPLGGQFTLGQAKGVDFVTGALFAPLMLAALAFLWFRSARSSMCVNEGIKRQGVSLLALAEASCTSTGSYNPIKLQKLFSSGRFPLVSLGFLTLLVALAGSLLSNIIAYEAYERHHRASNFTLTRLSDDIINRDDLASTELYSVGSAYSLNSNQTSTFADQTTGFLTGMVLRNVPALEGAAPAHIGINATSSSLALGASVRQLNNVDAYRSHLECEAIAPANLSVTQMSVGRVLISPSWPDERYLYQSWYPGQIESLQTANNDDYAYAAFAMNPRHVFLGYLASFDLSTKLVNSSYGIVYPEVYNMTPSGFSGTKTFMSSWGLNCTIWRQSGSANLTRKESSLDWTIDSSSFESEKRMIRMVISDWQLSLGWSGPGSTSPGLAPAMGFSISKTTGLAKVGLDVFAKNFLEAALEFERFAYDVAATNVSRAKNFTVQGAMDVQLYRITYIPAILLASLLAICVAAWLTAALDAYSRYYYHAPRGRRIDGLRLLSDMMLEVQEGQAYHVPKASSTSDDIDKWGKDLRVYYKLRKEDTNTSVRLGRV